MSHHYGQVPSNFFNDLGFGATNKFPDGKINEQDQGEILFGITVKDNTVVMSFGKSVEWIGFTREEAIQVGQNLIDRARQI